MIGSCLAKNHKIVSYLCYKDIENLENSCHLIKKIFQEIKLWEKKIRSEYPHFAVKVFEEEPSNVYWQLKYLDHYCNNNCYNLCNTCYTKKICFNITHCDFH